MSKPSNPGAGASPADQPRYQISVLDRALDVLEVLASNERPVGVSEIARQIGTTKTAVFRILATLEHRGYVRRHDHVPTYVPGARLITLGERARREIDVRAIARPYLEQLNERFGETVNLGVLAQNDIIYIDMAESAHGLRMAARVGAHDPAYATALGKAILAYLPPAERERHLPDTFVRCTPGTVRDRDALAQELAAVRERGVAEEIGQNEIGARCLGAAIFDHRGVPVAAISVSAPETRMETDRVAAIAEALRQLTMAISAELGGVVPEDPRQRSTSGVRGCGLQLAG